MTEIEIPTQNPPPYSENFKEAGECLRLALSTLSQYRIPPSPVNFRIGYDSVSGNQALKKSFDRIVNTPDIDQQGELWSLYQEHFIQDEDSLEKMRKELKQLLSTLQTDFSSSDGNLNTFTAALGQFSTALACATSHEDMTEKVSTMVNETQIAEKSQNVLNAKLSSAMGEIDTLRQELDKAKAESLTDALTEITNRKGFDKTLGELIEESEQTGTPFCLILGDIDHFKSFNDTHGHLIGDKVLRFVATVLKRSVKGKDTVARYGGEEFAILLPETDLTGAQIVAEQIRSAISAGKLKNKAGDKSYGQITISLGISQFRMNDLPASMIKRSDDALYRAKDNGRNRVEKAA